MRTAHVLMGDGGWRPARHASRLVVREKVAASSSTCTPAAIEVAMASPFSDSGQINVRLSTRFNPTATTPIRAGVVRLPMA